MRCSTCQTKNQPDALFCVECGLKIEPPCPACDVPNAPTAKFCRRCGASLVVQPKAADKTQARKVVTIVFADLVGSTALHERLDAESARHLMERYYRALQVAVDAHGGTVVKLMGDGVMAAFGVPRVAEDDAIRAVRAGVAMQHTFGALADEQAAALGDLGLRVAVNTGEVIVSADNTDVVGDPVNVAARLQQEAHVGDVVIGESTWRLVSELITLAPLGAVSLKGRSESVAAYRVVSLDRPASAPATAFVGRDDELRRIVRLYDAAAGAPSARLAVILGSPGLGKSRLLDEVGRRLGDRATVLRAQCEAAGGATFAPLAKAVRSLLRIDDATGNLSDLAFCGDQRERAVEMTLAAAPGGDAVRAVIAAALSGAEPDDARIADGITALLAGTPASPEETFFVIRRFLAGIAAPKPVVLAIDDLQWAEPLLLDFIEHLVQWSAGVPLLVLVASRPELRDTRSSLAAPGGLVHEVVTLAGLDAGAATRLAANVIGAGELPAALAGRVLAASEGNPLFVGELVRMLVHDGALKREGDRWTTGVDLAALDMPPTIHALLAARIERLRAEDRLVLERAAVVGRQFSRAAVAHLLPREAQADLDARLESLRRGEIIESDAAWFLGEPGLRFHHGLIRDAAYRRVLKGTRAELHGRFADWIETRVGETVEHDEAIGWHLEQAHQHLRELGPIDAPGRAFGERAARYLAAAGRRALARDDLLPAANLLGRALDRLDAGDPARADLAIDWCEALLAAGDVGPAAKAIGELGRFISAPPLATPNPRLSAWHTCFTGQLAVLTDPQALRATSDAVAAAADELAAAGDAAGEAKGHFVHASALARLGKIGACEAALDRALAAARRVDDRRRSNAVLAVAPLAALWGPSPVTRASGRCLDVVRVLRITQGAPAVEAVALRCQAVLEALRGRTEAARRMIASSRRMVEELGITQGLLETEMFAGLIELIEGDTTAAEYSLRAAYEGLRTHGLGIDAARAAALLGRTLLAQGRAAEAEALSHESEALAGDDLQAAITWRRVRAEALARRGEHAAAVDFARAAVDIAAATDNLLLHADARTALAAAVRATGQRDNDGAAAEEARAIELWEAKGATVLAERARRAAGRVNQVDRSPDDRGAPVSRVRRRVRPNAATATEARLIAAMAALDGDALPDLFADGMETVHHPTGLVFNKEGNVSSLRMLLESQTPRFEIDTLATLGDSLSLGRNIVSATATTTGALEIGAFDGELVVLDEVDAQERSRRLEFFAADRLGDAVARLYERYAGLLPDGPERVRAAATARSVAIILGPLEPDRWPFAPAIEFVDHRTVGLGSVHGAQALRQGIRALLDLSEDFVTRLDDVLALQSDALLVLWTNFGTDRASGGAFERDLCQLLVFGRDGLVTRWEQFDAEHDAEARARFDELAPEDDALAPFAPSSRPPLAAYRGAEPPAAPTRTTEQRQHRVRANAATANIARLEAAVAARDVDAIAAQVTDGAEVMDHTTGAVYDWQELLPGWRSLMRTPDAMYRQEPLATLGDSLAVCRQLMSAGGGGWGKFDVGAYETEKILLVEVDAQGQRRRSEVFAAYRLGDAVARLYERYAELLPDGPERVRAAATARAFGALLGPFDLDRYATAVAPAIEYTDHRTIRIGSGFVRGAEALLRGLGVFLELADDIFNSVDDVLDLRPGALIVRETQVGTVCATGGAYERQFLLLLVFGTDGLVARWENFEAERENEALARFDELAPSPEQGRRVDGREGEPPAEPWAGRTGSAGASRSLTGLPTRSAEQRARRVRPNAATANAAQMETAIAARDAAALPALYADDLEVVDHPNGATFDREGSLATWLFLLRAEHGTCRYEPLATLGDALALCRLSTSASGFAGGKFDVAAYEREELSLYEVDAQGRRRRSEIFAADRLGDAVVRLYERYADLLPDGPERDRAAATARSVAVIMGPVDPDRFATAFASAIEVVDHRILGTWSARGVEAALEHHRSLLEVADGIVIREDDVLDLRPNALLVRRSNFGTVRASGGAYERQFLLLWLFGTDGLVSHWEFFDPDRAAEALARFDELTAELAARFTAAPPRVAKKVARRVRANAATAHTARLEAVLAMRDADALPTLFAEDMEAVHHPTGATYDRQGSLTTWRSLLRANDPRFAHETLGTLGDSLALCHLSTSASGFVGGRFDVGAYERVEILLVEVDAGGRRRRSEIFAVDRLGDAIARLYQCYAELLPDGPARARAAATARSIAALLGPFDPDRWATAFAPAVEVVDNRPLGTWSARGVEALLQHFRSLLDVAADIAMRVDDILSLHPDAFIVRRTNFGTDRAGGGAYERPFLVLYVVGADGLMARMEFFDIDREAEALARFDELTAPGFPFMGGEGTERTAAHFENEATRGVDRFDAAWAAGDWAAIAAGFKPGVRVSDRRRYAHLDLDRDQHLESLRFRFEMRSSRSTSEVVATRGQRLALTRSRFELADRDAGPSETESLVVSEIDQHGAAVALVTFDPDDLDAAYAELDARFDAGEGVSSGTQMNMVARDLAARDWDALGARLAPDIVVYDHRPIGWDTLRGPQAYIEMLKTLVDLAPDARIRADHVRVCKRKDLIVTTLRGTREGGAFEDQRVLVAEGDDQGRVRRIDFYTLAQLDEALARYDALAGTAEGRQINPPVSPLGKGRTKERSASPPQIENTRFDELTRAIIAPRIENAATRAADVMTETWNGRDWERLAALFPAGFRNMDRRKMMQVELDREQFLAGCRSFLEMASSEGTNEVLATRGNRLALNRTEWKGADCSVGPSLIDLVQLLEVNAAGEQIASVFFDLDDLNAAYAELDERYAAGEAAPYARASESLRRYARAVAARDWEAMASVLDPNLVFKDHRLIGWGTLHSREAVASMRALVDLAPDVTVRLDHVLALDDRGTFLIGRWVGSREGGAFEIPFVSVSVLGADEHIQRIDTYDLEQLDAARARFAELRPDPLRIPPNAATRAVERFWDCIARQDWEALRASCAPILWEDRRRLIRTSGDCDMVIANAKLISRAGTRALRTALATAGDRLALQRLSLTGGAEGQIFETDTLQVTEVDAEGGVVAFINFDPDDRRTASAEMLDRYARSEAARSIPAAAFEALRAINDHDLDRFRATLHDDFVFDDRRRTGVGRLEGADDYIASIRPLFAAAPDFFTDNLYDIAMEKRAWLAIGRTSGTLAEGGEFESVFVRLIFFRGDRLAGLEQFELEHLEAALARFEELRPDPLTIPPNAAVAFLDRIAEPFAARDWGALRALASDDFTYADRGKHAQVSGDVEVWIASVQFVADVPGFVERELIGTVGDRIAVERMVWTGEPDTGAFEIESISLVEVDANGRLVAWIDFDPDDRRTASAEAQACFVAGEAAAIGGQAPIAVVVRAFARRDWETLRGCLADDLVLRDYRRLGLLGALHPDEWVESMRVQAELAPDSNVETLRIITWDRHGRVEVSRVFGTISDGGPFENVFLRVMVTDGDRIQHFELFDVGDADQALARFAELCKPDAILQFPRTL